MNDFEWIIDTVPTKTFKVILVDRPMQSDRTPIEHVQYIDGEVKEWVVRSEMMIVDETFQQWWTRRKEHMLNDPVFDNVLGIYLYDLQSLSGIVSPDSFDIKTSMIVRYDYIRE